MNALMTQAIILDIRVAIGLTPTRLTGAAIGARLVDAIAIHACIPGAIILDILVA